MHKVEPQVFLVGETRVVEEGLQAYLDHIGIPDWTSDAPTDAERITEVMGRLGGGGISPSSCRPS